FSTTTTTLVISTSAAASQAQDIVPSIRATMRPYFGSIRRLLMCCGLIRVSWL
ncbi:hypothetical protein HK102_013077, partial [Quaeritorhiza haematococci]